MRALLVSNPVATTTSPRVRDVIARALGHDLKLEVALTGRRGHAAELAAGAREDGVDLVIAVGGDGTVNEVVNGLLGSGAPQEGPALAVVPTGSTNVFARAIGLPADPVEATGALLDALRARRVRRVGLGRAGARWFTFAAGMGLDAEVVARVERYRSRGATSTSLLYLRATVEQFYLRTNRRHGPVTVERPGREPVPGLFLALVQNTAPWTFMGPLPLNPSPRASFDTGLDLFGLTRLGTATTLRHAAGLLSPGGHRPRGRGVVALHDEPELVLRADPGVAFQLDGEHLGTTGAVRFTSAPGVLPVVV